MNTQATPEAVTIGDVLRLALPLDTHLVGKSDQARRTVDWVVMLTNWDNLSEQAHQGDLVIIPPHLQKGLSETNFRIHLQKFADLRISGLIIFYAVKPSAKLHF